MVVSKRRSAAKEQAHRPEPPEAMARRLSQDMKGLRMEIKQLRQRLEAESQRVEDLAKAVGSLIRKASVPERSDR